MYADVAKNRIYQEHQRGIKDGQAGRPAASPLPLDDILARRSYINGYERGKLIRNSMEAVGGAGNEYFI